MASRMPTAWYRKRARALYHRSGEIEIDEDAEVSRTRESTTDHGAYVNAWIWIDDPDEPEAPSR